MSFSVSSSLLDLLVLHGLETTDQNISATAEYAIVVHYDTPPATAHSILMPVTV